MAKKPKTPYEQLRDRERREQQARDEIFKPLRRRLHPDTTVQDLPPLFDYEVRPYWTLYWQLEDTLVEARKSLGRKRGDQLWRMVVADIIKTLPPAPRRTLDRFEASRLVGEWRRWQTENPPPLNENKAAFSQWYVEFFHRSETDRAVYRRLNRLLAKGDRDNQHPGKWSQTKEH